jgi:hypothetical protein
MPYHDIVVLDLDVSLESSSFTGIIEMHLLVCQRKRNAFLVGDRP